jgi:hypothetical protein
MTEFEDIGLKDEPPDKILVFRAVLNENVLNISRKEFDIVLYF